MPHIVEIVNITGRQCFDIVDFGEQFLELDHTLINMIL